MAQTIHNPNLPALAAALLSKINAGGNISITGLLTGLGFTLPPAVQSLIAPRDTIVRTGDTFRNSGGKIATTISHNGTDYKIKIPAEIGGSITSSANLCQIDFVDDDILDLINIKPGWFGANLESITIQPDRIDVETSLINLVIVK